MTFSPEQLNFFKFSTVVLDVLPFVLRLVFASMWDNLVATSPGIRKWDDSAMVRNMFLAKEGGVKKVPTLNKSYKEWDCTALFKATLFSQTFAMPDGTGGVSTLDKLYVKPRSLSSGTFHTSVISPTGNQAETYALALDQLRRLRNTLCHPMSTREIDKATFDDYILLAKDAIIALGQNTSRIDEIGKLAEEDFPTARLQKVEDELKREKDAAIKFKHIDERLNKIVSQVEDVGSDMKDVKTEVKDVKKQVKGVLSDVKYLMAYVCDVIRATQAESAKGPLFPNSCIPDKIPHFVGRQEECQAVLDHLTNRDTRLVDVWGPPGFGKTTVAINVAHQLREMKIPVYFTSLRGMKGNDDLVSKLLSIFTVTKQVPHPHISASDWLIQCLQQLHNTFVLILDNADDVVESGDAKLKKDVLGFTEKILAQCSYIKLVRTTRESLDYLSHKLPIHQEKVGLLGEVSSIRLVQSLLPTVSDDDSIGIVKVCGQVPLVMRLMCSFMREEDVSLSELSEELKISPLVELLDAEFFSDDARLKTVINKSFERLTGLERNAFVSLVVFPGCFRRAEATAVLNLTDRQTKKIIRSLERKSLIDCSKDFASFTIHSLFRSFIDERRKVDQETRAVFLTAQHRFYSYYISSFGVANEKFLTGKSNEALADYLLRRESIILSLSNGTRDDELYSEAVDILSKAELFLYAILLHEEFLFQTIYDTAVEEARKRKNVNDERRLLAAKSVSRCWVWFSSDLQTWDYSLQAGYTDATDCPAKLLCYFGIHQIHCGKLDEGISSLKNSVDRLSNCCDETVLKQLVYQVLVVSHFEEQEVEMSSYFVDLYKSEAKAGSACVGGVPFHIEKYGWSSVKDDAFLFSVTNSLLHLSTKLKTIEKKAAHECILCKMQSMRASAKKFCIKRVESSSKANLKMLKQDLAKGRLITSKLIKKEQEFITDDVAKFYFSFCGSCIDSFIDSQDSISITSFYQVIDKILRFLKSILSAIKKFLGQLFSNVTAAILKQRIEKILEKLLQLYKKDQHVDFEPSARSYDLIGKTLHLVNDYSGAIEAHQKAIRVREQTIGDHVDTASSLTSIGCVYFEMNNEIEAVKSFQNALKLRKQLGVYDHVDTANIYHTLGGKHFNLGNHQKAIEAHLQALELRKKHLENHPLTGESLHQIAVVYYTTGDEGIRSVLSCHNPTETSLQLESYKAALAFCQQALSMRLELLGEHVDTASSFFVIGLIHFKMCDFPSAVEAFQKASDMKSNLLGDHKDTALSYHWLGLAQCETGDLNGALQSLQMAFQLRKKRSLRDHLKNADCNNAIGHVHCKMGDFQCARERFQDAVDLYRKILDKHESTATSSVLQDGRLPVC